MLLLLLHTAVGLKVLVTGAGGRLGRLVFEELKQSESIEPVGLARSGKAQRTLKKAGASPDQIVSCDVNGDLDQAMANCDAVILCTSAVPMIKPLSALKAVFGQLTFGVFGRARPQFKWSRGGTPEEVDWLGAKNQIDAAVRSGVKKFVFCSSMGGTNPDNFLNSIGKRADGTAGDILLWKRKAERYLIASGLDYTIVHPGGLLDQPPAQRELLLGFDDDLLNLKSRSIPRSDVARVLVAALTDARASNKSFDLASKLDGSVTTDVASLFDQLQGRTCDYSTVLPDPPSVFAASDDDAQQEPTPAAL